MRFRTEAHESPGWTATEGPGAGWGRSAAVAEVRKDIATTRKRSADQQREDGTLTTSCAMAASLPSDAREGPQQPGLFLKKAAEVRLHRNRGTRCLPAARASGNTPGREGRAALRPCSATAVPYSSRWYSIAASPRHATPTSCWTASPSFGRPAFRFLRLYLAARRDQTGRDHSDAFVRKELAARDHGIPRHPGASGDARAQANRRDAPRSQSSHDGIREPPFRRARFRFRGRGG